MIKKIVSLVFVLGLVALFLGFVSRANAAPTTELKATLTEFKVAMSSQTVPLNTPVKFIAVNTGFIEHELVIEKAGAIDEAIEVTEENEKAEAEIEHILPGMTKSAVWTINEPGEYQLACHTPGHYEAGMVQKFTVADPASIQMMNTAIALAGGGIVIVLGLVVVGAIVWRRSARAQNKMI